MEHLENLGKPMESELEELLRSCPRCGKTSANKSNPQGRCRACLNKLARAKKTPGSSQRAQTKADDALRRQDGKNGTASHKSKGRGTRESIVKQTQSAEKKTGQKLSPDRKNNSKGYAAKNTRMVPEKLNRGRHHVDTKKLAAWKKRLKKHGIELDDFMTLLRAKALQNNNAILEKTLNLLDIERLVSHLPFKKTDTEVFEELSKAIEDEVGKTHTVEVHPDMDHFYRAKGFIKDSGKDAMHVSGFKKSGISPNIIAKLPRDGKGMITPDMIDSHISSLPKSKVDVDVLPYRRGEQMHRNNPEYILSMRLHPEEKAKIAADPRKLAAWDHMKMNQHDWSSGSTSKDKDQFGFVRIDANKNTPEGPIPHDHWHYDEIQSDFQNKKKLQHRLPYSIDEDIDSMLSTISHNHEDPQHLLHSVANALGRRLGVGSTSIGMPLDQAKKSTLRGYRDGPSGMVQNRDGEEGRWVPTPQHRQHGGWHHMVDAAINSDGVPEEHNAAVWHKYGKKLADEHMTDDPDFASAANKLGTDKLKEFAQLAHNRTQGYMFNGESDYDWDTAEDTHKVGDEKISPELAEKLKGMTGDEKNALSTFLLKHSGNVQSHVAETNGWGSRPNVDAPYQTWVPNGERAPAEAGVEEKKEPLPIHQVNTYNKRPKKLGMEVVDKESILGHHPDDKTTQIQYSKLHKKLKEAQEILKKST